MSIQVQTSSPDLVAAVEAMTSAIAANTAALAAQTQALISLTSVAQAIEDTIEPKAQSALLTYKSGDHIMQTLLVGQTASPLFQEWSGPNQTGDILPPAGAISFASSDETVVSVDASTGVATGVGAPGGSAQATITATDAGNNLQAQCVITVQEVAQSASLEYTPNAVTPAVLSAAAARTTVKK